VTDGSRGPGWREVLIIAVAVILVVFALELASAVLPPVHDAFVSFPTTIVVLVAGTIGVLAFAVLGRPR
jgi:uncharacterized membrane-anchored protein